MFHIQPSSTFKSLFPQFTGAAIYAEVRNSETSDALKADIDLLSGQLLAAYTVDSIKQREGILATRQAYKAAGKDPSRYRPAC